ncbi:MAG TPA: hypothetical protein VG077_18785 [Verrucomicrobiae bacterium]|nr:hypothetical protein [Verrucomicrobiae bacterium]
MKTRNFQRLPLTIMTLATLVLATGSAVAQDSTTTTATTAQPAAASQAAPQLSYGVPEVLQLSQAKVGDSVIVNYIQNSGNNYGLNAAQIIYLRQQGVSDTVINTMLNQRSQSAQTASTLATSSDNSAAYSTQTGTTTTQPAVTYVQTVPTSTVYVVPDTQTYYYNNWLYSRSPYYYFGNYPSYGYCWPYSAVSVSYGWGGGWGGYWGGYRGGWHVDRDHFRGGWRGGGGWHSSGGWHGGGGWHH